MENYAVSAVNANPALHITSRVTTNTAQNKFFPCPVFPEWYGNHIAFVFNRNDYKKENRGGGGSYSGTGYDRWSYEHSAPGSNDTALNKLQHKYWVAKQVLMTNFFLTCSSNFFILFMFFLSFFLS